MKKIVTLTLTITLAIAMILTLVACDDSDATPAPEPDAKAQAPTSEPAATPEPTLEQCQHEWLAADCENPETCSLCGETQGEPLGHEFEGGNFQEATICVLCGAEGEPVTPGAVSSRLRLDKVIGTAYQYDTLTCMEIIVYMGGEITLLTVEVASKWGNYEAPEGYEFIVAEFDAAFMNFLAYELGVDLIVGLLDYYSFDPSGELAKPEGVEAMWAILGPTVDLEVIKKEDRGVISGDGLINYYGEDIEFMLFTAIDYNWGRDGSSFDLTYAVQVPIGYDGIVIAFIDSQKLEDNEDGPAGDYIDRNTLLFRLRG